MQKRRVRSLSWADTLEKELATHSNILAREIPWTEEPDGLQSMGSQKSQTRFIDKTTTTKGRFNLDLCLQKSLIERMGCIQLP